MMVRVPKRMEAKRVMLRGVAPMEQRSFCPMAATVVQNDPIIQGKRLGEDAENNVAKILIVKENERPAFAIMIVALRA